MPCLPAEAKWTRDDDTTTTHLFCFIVSLILTMLTMLPSLCLISLMQTVPANLLMLLLLRWA